MCLCRLCGCVCVFNFPLLTLSLSPSCSLSCSLFQCSFASLSNPPKRANASCSILKGIDLEQAVGANRVIVVAILTYDRNTDGVHT
uniref:Putative secreted protein n=1 Tax=Anopheles marajoara TaxID=58244 RepID=A0A2M4CAK7_9DIPT